MADTVDFTIDEVNALIARVEYALEHDLSVSSDDLKQLLELLLGFNARLNRQKSTIDKLRKLSGLVSQAEAGPRDSNGKPKRPPRRKRNNKSGFAKGEAPEVKHNVEKHALESPLKGSQCPDCESGTLAKVEPASFARFSAQAPLTVTRHILEQIRCNTCGAYFSAPLPESTLADGARGQQYGYSARAMMVVYKNLIAVPYFRQQSLQQVLGFPVAASTIYDQCREVSEACEPVVKYLKALAAEAPHFALDDTTNRILNETGKEIADRRTQKPRHRTGVYTSALVATLESDHPVILFKTNIGHAGEWIDEILSARQSLDPPVLMSDALNRNQPTVIDDFYWSKCNAHARREFIACFGAVPRCEGVIEDYATIWQNDTYCFTAKMSAQQRQKYHHEHSLPVMESLKKRCQQWLDSGEVEANSNFGQACSYFINHYEGLCAFCHILGAKLDNNGVERILKKIILIRKNSLFYKTQNGADVGDILTSILATAIENNVNAFEYLIVLQQNWLDVGRNPQRWVPWKYRETLQSLSKIDEVIAA